MTKKITRRQALLGVSSTLLLQAACSNSTDGSNEPPDAIFAHGVASGDPDQSSVVIWTRVSNISGPVDVDWFVATDADFQNIAAQGRFTTDGNRDHTVKVVAGNLQPGQDYYYQFAVNDTTSIPGRTKTLPVGHLERLVIAVASCSNFPFGYFNAYEVIANDPEIDVVAHLGDYIYEYSTAGYGGETGRRIGRDHEPPHEINSLADYRQRHAQYKTDPGSLAMHARHPLIVIWDDHESANNPWMEGAENHQADEGDWHERRSASLKAYYEWLPIRDPAPGFTPEQYWRHYKFGDLVSLITLESRHSGRSQQIEYPDQPRFETESEAQEFYDTVVRAPGRNFLSSELEAFLADEFEESVDAGRRWRIIGNQSVMAKSVEPRLVDPFFEQLWDQLNEEGRRSLDSRRRLGALRLPGDLDAWDGYPEARERFYQVAKDAGAHDLLVISGDSHSYWANALYDDDGMSMGVELGTTGISSPRSLLSLGEEGLRRYDELIAAQNKEIVWADGRHRGFIRLAIDHEGATAEYVTVSNVETRDYETRIVYTANIESTDGALRYV